MLVTRTITLPRERETNPPYPATPRTLPLDGIWQGSAIIWTVLAGEGIAALLALAPGVPGDRWAYFGLASLAVQWVALTTLGVLYLLRRPLARLRPQHVAYTALLLLVASTWAVGATGWALLHEVWSQPRDAWPGFFLRMTALALTIGLLGLAAFQNHWRTRQMAIRAKQAELAALQARIRPHFLFNTLNTGVALVHQRPEAVEQLLLDLSDLFRAALSGPRQIPLAEELDLARRYLEIEQLRFGERLKVRWELPRGVPQVTVPALSIQPLIENAVRHGAERAAPSDIEVAVSTTPDLVVVRISNPVPPEDAPDSRGHHVGLHASRARIEALTDGRGSVRTELLGGRFVATVRLPVD